MSGETSLYVHVPFCASGLHHPGKCGYCDFYSVPVKTGDPRPALFTETLLSEGERLFDSFKPADVPTLYIGGGTPSVLGPDGIRRLLKGLLALIARYASSPPKEITVEANPESADEAFLAAARESGATRLSLGVQTFHAPSRRLLRRIGAEDDAFLHERLALAAQYFPGSFSVDLISGLPQQNETVLLEDIVAVLSYQPAHVSLYALTVEEGTPLASSLAAGLLTLPDRDEADRLWISGRGALEKAAYAQYEVSNFCLSGKESLHNVRYWRMQSWLGLGPAASGTIINDEAGTGRRYTIPPDVDTWLSGCFSPQFEELDTPTLIKEHFLMGFRYIDGPDEDIFRRRFNTDIASCIPKTLRSWRERGLLRSDKCALTKEGLLFLDRFLVEAFQEFSK